MPAAPGYQAGEGGQPDPVRGILADRVAELTAQHRILMPEYEQFGVLGRVAVQQYPWTDSSLRASL